MMVVRKKREEIEKMRDDDDWRKTLIVKIEQRIV